jgi:hypothetical protein
MDDEEPDSAAPVPQGGSEAPPGDSPRKFGGRAFTVFRGLFRGLFAGCLAVVSLFLAFLSTYEHDGGDISGLRSLAGLLFFFAAVALLIASVVLPGRAIAKALWPRTPPADEESSKGTWTGKARSGTDRGIGRIGDYRTPGAGLRHDRVSDQARGGRGYRRL